MPTTHSTSTRSDVADDELELPVEEVAARLGLPAAMLIRRIEAGDIPARRSDDEHGTHYTVRIADLGTSSRVVLPPVAAPSAVAVEARNGNTADVHTSVAADDQPFAGAEPPTESRHDMEAELLGEAAAGDDVTDAVPPPPPVRGTVELAPIAGESGPRAELTAMAIDPRELVAGLLDRWERTLEQRIYAEQRQRFEAELTNRQAKVKQLQLELDAARAEHAAALAEKERMLAERLRELAERERELDRERARPRRGWFFGR
jgi:hypothetical protein